jgi:hypothetical protein
MLVLAQNLIRKDEHRVALEGIFDDAEIGVRKRLGKIDVADFGNESVSDRPDSRAHEYPPSTRTAGRRQPRFMLGDSSESRAALDLRLYRLQSG